MFNDEKDHGFTSELTLGYYDKSKYVGDLHWIPVEKQHMFAFKLDDI